MIPINSACLKKLFIIFFILINISAYTQVIIKNDIANKMVSFNNSHLQMTLAYNDQVKISQMEVNGQKVIKNSTGIYGGVRTAVSSYSTRQLLTIPRLKISGNTILLENIKYGDPLFYIIEKWKFTILKNDIHFDIERVVSKTAWVEEVSLPVFHFDDINSWEGAYQDYGGLAWFYLFNEKLATYGVHSNTSSFWNSKTGNGLKIAVDAKGKEVAMKYSRTATDQLAYTIALSENEMIPRFDSGTNRKRFIRQRTDVWAPFQLAAGKSSQRITFSYFDFNKQYGRGNLVGMNGQQVSAVLNTIARIGVIDKKHFGGNSWHTPYGPICLHEQYIAQMGLAINDSSYLKGYEECLDYYRDNAIKPDGRVWSRWAYNNVDIMPGQVTNKGFYEAQWGYLMDSNPDLVTNVAELYDQTGNKKWVRSHQRSCELALDWIIKRDTDGDGLVEMMTDSHKEKRGSDWIDIIWAAYENAFVNAKLYFALVKWSDVEKQLGNRAKAKQYEDFAEKLKASFNKSTRDGGFWDEEKGCFIHWRDKDNSIHGNNMVTPVNFMAIAYGICDDLARRNRILDEIENHMVKEKLFFWPLNLYTYQLGEGNDWQFPFPNYENGDIFLSWGAVGVKAYANYKPEIALKYVRNVMEQHSKDGLAYQRYGRAKQDGLGDDILSGNSLSVVGLYQAVYGINPLYNRFYLNPHITPELAGTEVNYNFRGQKLKIGLNTDSYSVANNRFKIISDQHFGFYNVGNELSYFHGSRDTASLHASTSSNSKLSLEIKQWDTNEMSWTQMSTDKQPKKVVYQIHTAPSLALYTITINDKSVTHTKGKQPGSLVFNYTTGKTVDKIVIKTRS